MKKEVKKDFLGNELKLGDKVVFMRVGYREFAVGEIISLSNKKAKIKHKENNICRTETIQFYGQIIKYQPL